MNKRQECESPQNERIRCFLKNLNNLFVVFLASVVMSAFFTLPHCLQLIGDWLIDSFWISYERYHMLGVTWVHNMWMRCWPVWPAIQVGVLCNSYSGIALISSKCYLIAKHTTFILCMNLFLLLLFAVGGSAAPQLSLHLRHRFIFLIFFFFILHYSSHIYKVCIDIY